jgi:glycosyltransferase involved in cell wall biosynthesis
MRVAITTEWLDSFGGAERVLCELQAMFPDAPIYTTVHDPSRLPAEMQGWDVRTSFIQRIPLIRRSHAAFLPLMPMAFEQLDLREYDLVITTNSACAKGVITQPGTVNICYCYTPCRYLWDLYHEYTRDHPARWAIAPVAHWMRAWDRLAADRVDHFVGISAEVAGRIRRHYRRDADVIYPPVAIDRYTPTGRPAEDFYLVVSRLVSYKRVDLAVEAAMRLGRRLVVVGTGPELPRLKRMAGAGVEFLGARPDAEIADLYARCRALLFPGFEDFGITPVEAQAAGRPVVAFGRGGATETVMDGTTGVHFAEQSVESLVQAMLRLEQTDFDPQVCRANAQRFDAAVFRRRMRTLIEAQVEGLPRDVAPLRAASSS